MRRECWHLSKDFIEVINVNISKDRLSSVKLTSHREELLINVRKIRVERLMNTETYKTN
jgi:hypothetical protein